MTNPCQFQSVIMKHGEDIAKNTQALDSMAPNIEKIASNVEILTNKLSNMKGFVAGVAACGCALGGIVTWIAKSIPAFVR